MTLPANTHQKGPGMDRSARMLGSVLIGMALFYGPPLAWWLWSMIDAIAVAQTMAAPWQ